MVTVLFKSSDIKHADARKNRLHLSSVEITNSKK